MERFHLSAPVMWWVSAANFRLVMDKKKQTDKYVAKLEKSLSAKDKKRLKAEAAEKKRAEKAAAAEKKKREKEDKDAAKRAEREEAERRRAMEAAAAAPPAEEAEAARSCVRWHVSRPCGTLHCFALPSTPASFLIISAIFARRMPAAPKLAWRSEGRHACAGCGSSRLCGGGCGRR